MTRPLYISFNLSAGVFIATDSACFSESVVAVSGVCGRWCVMGGPRRERMVMLVVRVEPGVALRFALGFAVLGRVYWDGLAW